MIRRFSDYLDERPVLAMILSTLMACLILYFATPALFERAEQPTHRSAT